MIAPIKNICILGAETYTQYANIKFKYNFIYFNHLTYSTIDHARNNALCFSKIGINHAAQVKKDKGIDQVLAKAMYFL